MGKGQPFQQTRIARFILVIVIHWVAINVIWWIMLSSLRATRARIFKKTKKQTEGPKRKTFFTHFPHTFFLPPLPSPPTHTHTTLPPIFLKQEADHFHLALSHSYFTASLFSWVSHCIILFISVVESNPGKRVFIKP